MDALLVMVSMLMKSVSFAKFLIVSNATPTFQLARFVKLHSFLIPMEANAFALVVKLPLAKEDVPIAKFQDVRSVQPLC